VTKDWAQSCEEARIQSGERIPLPDNEEIGEREAGAEGGTQEGDEEGDEGEGEGEEQEGGSSSDEEEARTQRYQVILKFVKENTSLPRHVEDCVQDVLAQVEGIGAQVDSLTGEMKVISSQVEGVSEVSRCNMAAIGKYRKAHDDRIKELEIAAMDHAKRLTSGEGTMGMFEEKLIETRNWITQSFEVTNGQLAKLKSGNKGSGEAFRIVYEQARVSYEKSIEKLTALEAAHAETKHHVKGNIRRMRSIEDSIAALENKVESAILAAHARESPPAPKPVVEQPGTSSKAPQSVQTGSGSAMYSAQIHMADGQRASLGKGQRPTEVIQQRPDGAASLPNPQHLQKQLAGKVGGSTTSKPAPTSWDKGVYDSSQRKATTQGAQGSKPGGSRVFHADFGDEDEEAQSYSAGGGNRDPGVPTQYVDYSMVGYGASSYRPTEAEFLEDQATRMSLEALTRTAPGLGPINRSYGSHIAPGELISGATKIVDGAKSLEVENRGGTQHRQGGRGPNQDFQSSRGRPMGPPATGHQGIQPNQGQWGMKGSQGSQSMGSRDPTSSGRHPKTCECLECAWLKG
jgi:hypothetical protein